MLRQTRDPSKQPVRAALVAVFVLGFILSAIPEAKAQMGAAGTGGGGSSGGSSGRGSRGSKEKAKVKRNEQPAVDSQQSRDKLKQMLEIALTRGTVSPPFVANLFDQASTHTQPASSQSRRALAEALALPLKGTKLEAETASEIAETIALAVNIDGAPPEDLETKKEPLKQALSTAGMDDESAATIAAYEQVVADQQNDQIKAVMEILQEIQKEGEVSDDQKNRLAEGMTAMIEGDAKPDEAKVKSLAADLGKSLDSAQLTNKEKAQLAFNLKLALSSALPPAQFQPLLNDIRKIMKDGLAKQADIQAVATDLQDVQKSLAG